MKSIRKKIVESRTFYVHRSNRIELLANRDSVKDLWTLETGEQLSNEELTDRVLRSYKNCHYTLSGRNYDPRKEDPEITSDDTPFEAAGLCPECGSNVEGEPASCLECERQQFDLEVGEGLSA